jgi:ABC-type transporter Mla maintaining outer membrane lipid asymmetry ATPase subunit MlaF
MSSNKLEVRNLSFGFRGKSLFHDISFGLGPGESLMIGGRSGCGKSTLIEVCAGLHMPEKDRVFWNGRDIAGFARHELMQERQKIGFVFQRNALVQNFPIFDNIALPLRYHTDLPEQEIRNRVRAQLGRFGLLDVAGYFPEALSLGQARCAALARALVFEPDLLLLDEPTGDVDPITAQLIVHILKELRMRKEITCLIIGHNTALSRELHCTVKILDRGELIDLNDYNASVGSAFPEFTSFLHGAV